MERADYKFGEMADILGEAIQLKAGIDKVVHNIMRESGNRKSDHQHQTGRDSPSQNDRQGSQSSFRNQMQNHFDEGPQVRRRLSATKVMSSQRVDEEPLSGQFTIQPTKNLEIAERDEA